MDDHSRNSWINKAEPKDVSSQAKHKDHYEDIVEERRSTSDLKYVLRTRLDIPVFKDRKPRTPAEIKAHVLNSDRVKYRVEKICEEQGLSPEVVTAEAMSILDEMAHDQSMGAIRGFAYALIKVFKALFNRIYVNEDGVQRLRQLLREYPVLVMPSHRSYMDFLLVSYIFYNYDLPLPVIAAAMDFKGMKFFGWLLRKSGAFYIRRSFGSDLLYWAVFTEYVQTQLRNGDYPMEFFVEGTRSRTAKSYVPRIGMLSASLESYFKAEVPDVMIVPISISYERILEETLYAYELLGIPKPKESASGVLKARSVLSEDYGSVHFYIGEPISIRKFSDGKIDRGIHSLEPRYINNLQEQEQELMRQLAYKLVRQQQAHMVISPWALMATVLMQNREGIQLKLLLKEVEWLKRQAYNRGAYVDWPGNASPESVIRHYLSLHSNLVSVGREDLVTLQMTSRSKLGRHLPAEVMLNAATQIALGSYRNQLLHVFVRTGMVALVVNACTTESVSVETLFKGYSFLERLFSREFIFEPGETKKAFDEAVLTLSNSGSLLLREGRVCVRESINKHTTFLSQMLEPFLMAYWVLCQHLLSLTPDVHGRPHAQKPRTFALGAQRLGVSLLQDMVVPHHEMLSLDILNNGLLAMVHMEAFYADKRDESSYVSPNAVQVSKVADEIGKYIELPSVAVSLYTSNAKNVLIPAKL